MIPDELVKKKLENQKLISKFWASGEEKQAFRKLSNAGCLSHEMNYIRNKGAPTSNEYLIKQL